jgi:hypothetical protein
MTSPAAETHQELFARILAAASSALLAVFLAASLAALLPLRFTDPTWQLGVIGSLVNNGGFALISLVLSYFVLPGHVAGERLVNLLVHGGLNPICTGLIFGFSAVWLAALVEEKALPVPQRLAWALIVLLHLAAFFSGSRGVMLALACGHAALLLARGWRRGKAALGVFVITGMLYFTSAPLLARIAAWRAESAVVIEAPALTHHLQKAVERGDNGRFDIYRAGWNALDNLWLGTGQWGVCDVWQCELQPDPCSMMTHLQNSSGFAPGNPFISVIGHTMKSRTVLSSRVYFLPPR